MRKPIPIELDDEDRAALERISAHTKMARVEVIRNLIRDCDRMLQSANPSPPSPTGEPATRDAKGGLQ